MTFAFICASGCDHDDNSSEPAIVLETNAPVYHPDKPPDKKPDTCFPIDYFLPEVTNDLNNTTVTILTIGSPGDPYYQIMVTTVQDNNIWYADGTSYSLGRTTSDDTIISLGITNLTYVKEEQISIQLYDDTTISSELIEHAEDGLIDQHEYSAFLECTDGTITAISEAEFDSFTAQIGL